MTPSPLSSTLLLLTLTTVGVSAEQPINDLSQPTYGVDVSFPIHHGKISTNYAWLPHNQDSSLPVPKEYEGMPVQYLGDKQGEYDEFMKGCHAHYGK
jgi:hypothetical protein